MFGASNPFGQSSNSPFGTTQPVFGQASNVSSGPFALKPFGSPTTPFGAQTGSSIFGGTSTGMFGAPQTSSFSATNAFGSSTPAFGASTTPAFGSSSSSAFGAGSSVFGQKPFGGFGSTTQTSPFGNTNQQPQPGFGSTTQTSPFGNTNQQPQPGFGNTNQQPQPGFGSTTQTSPFGNTNQQPQPGFGNNSLFGSTPFGAPSQSAFGAASTPAFGTTTAPAFGATSTTPAFGSTSTTPAFGAPSTTPAFGSTATPGFGSTGASYTSSPLFGAGGAFGTSTSVFGSSATTPAFGGLTGSGFGTPTTSAFGATTTSAFGATSSPSFTFSSSPGFGQSTSTFGSSPFGSTTSTFPAQPSPFGAQPTTSAFGNTGFAQPGFGGHRPGTRAAPYAETAEAEGGAQAGKLVSISAMPAYKDKSHEELRWEDYQLGDKGGPLPPGQSPGGAGYSMSTPQANPFAPSTGLGQTSTNMFSSTATNLFAPKTQTSTPSFTTASPFGPSTSSNLFQPSTPAFSVGSSPSLFGSTSMPNFSTTPSLFSSTTGQGNASPFGSNMFNNTQSSLSFPSTTPSMGQTTAFPQSNPFGPSTTSSLFNSPATGGLFSSTQSQITPNLGGFNQMTPSQPAQNAGIFSLNFSQTQAAGNSGFAGVSSNFGQPFTTQNAVAVQPVPITNPFGTLPAMPQVSFGRAGTTPSVQYGISTMPVVEKPSPIRISSLLTSRHLSQRRIRLPMRKYYPKHDGPKVPFFSDEEETPSTPKADALFIPRENPRALVIRPMDQWPSRESAEKASPLNASAPVHENGKFSVSEDACPSNGSTAGDKNKNSAENGVIKEQVKVNQKPNGVHEDHATQKEESYMTLSGHRAGEAAIVYEHGADIEALMPKLRRSDYFTEPRIQELAAKERARPGFCRHVKDFVVGRHGYGSIKFLVETDVRRLDLESLVQFNNREVIVYMDDSKKPPVGQGLNKPAEVTLLNIKCIDKKTGRQFTEGPKIERYKEMLKRKAEDQGAEFVSYDPVKGEWKFKVNHFSKYMLEDEGEEDWDVVQATCNKVDDCLVLKE
ncbi:nuclear pore complex protein NUP98A isoform X3 [Populus trichocarpa]|uniref:nuclear pore complex protein NUP98A isoform X3 n=1 Tax=Populus trichocarpa TaxID=3694 RepID=UPI002277E753|nr:nuclear pore complex protein NUP98A isoform X3 [Populus trichocarpa]